MIVGLDNENTQVEKTGRVWYPPPVMAERVTQHSSLRIINARGAFADVPNGIVPAKMSDIAFMHDDNPEGEHRIPNSRLVEGRTMAVTVVVFTESAPMPGVAVKIGTNYLDEKLISAREKDSMDATKLLEEQYGLDRSSGANMLMIPNSSGGRPFEVAMNGIAVFDLKDRYTDEKETHIRLAVNSSVAKQDEITRPRWAWIAPDELERGGPVSPETTQDFLTGVARVYDAIREAVDPENKVSPVTLRIVHRDPVQLLPKPSVSSASS